jgi:hypothetical protein
MPIIKQQDSTGTSTAIIANNTYYYGINTGTSAGLIGYNNTADIIIGNYLSTGGVRMYTNNIEQFTILSNGNVGVGITNPIVTLDIASVVRTGTHNPSTNCPLYVTGTLGATSAGIEFRHTNGTQGIGFGYSGIYQTSGGTITFPGAIAMSSTLGVTGNVTVSTGNVTVSTGNITLSAGDLSLSTASSILFGSATYQMLNLYGTAYGIGVQSSTQYFRSGGGYAWYFGGAHNTAANNSGGGTTLMTLSSGGDLIVYGNITASSSSVTCVNCSVTGTCTVGTLSATALNVSTSIMSVGGYRQGNGVSYKSGGFGTYFSIQTEVSTNAYTNTRLYVDANNLVGTLQITNSCDYRIKQNIEPIILSALDLINRTKPITFEYKDVEKTCYKADGIKHYGFIAHELAEIIPDAVNGEKDGFYEDGVMNIQTINQFALVTVLTKAVQELSSKNTQLELENITLKLRLDDLEQKINTILSNL